LRLISRPLEGAGRCGTIVTLAVAGAEAGS